MAYHKRVEVPAFTLIDGDFPTASGFSGRPCCRVHTGSKLFVGIERLAILRSHLTQDPTAREPQDPQDNNI